MDAYLVYVAIRHNLHLAEYRFLPVVILTHALASPTITSICRYPLERVPTYKYLDNLSWSQHMQNLCTKARMLLGLMYHCFTDSVAKRVFQNNVHLFSLHVLVWNVSDVWSPYKVREVNCIKGIQRYALHIIFMW